MKPYILFRLPFMSKISFHLISSELESKELGYGPYSQKSKPPRFCSWQSETPTPPLYLRTVALFFLNASSKWVYAVEEKVNHVQNSMHGKHQRSRGVDCFRVLIIRASCQ